MFEDTMADWQSLTKLYGEMSDQELLELDAQISDLTNAAQQVLRDEMKKRKLSAPRPADNAPKPIESPVALEEEYGALPSTAEAEAELSDQPHEFTWKTLLCECDNGEEAIPIRLALRQAGIQSWIEGPGYRDPWDMLNPRILVAADQLDQAREIISRPIPQAIVEECKAQPEEFKPPVCPTCGAEDPVLESTEPVNSWLCEECGGHWTDAAPPAE
jgi:hypothetical protein